jgi:choline-glycine betaine transporter
MKVIKPRKKLLFITVITLVIIGSILLWGFAPYLPHAVSIFWLVPLSLITLLFSKPLNITLTPDQSAPKKFAPFYWVLQIILFQLALFAIYFSFSSIANTLLPVMAPTNPTPHFIFHNLIVSLLHAGLFPWAGMTLVGIGMAYTSYIKGKDAYFSTLLSPILNKISPTDTIGLIVNHSARHATLFVLGSTMMFTALTIAATIAIKPMKHIMLGLHPASMITIAILFLLVFSKFTKERLYRLINKRKIPASVIFLVTVGLFAGFLAGISTILDSQTPLNFQPPSIAVSLAHRGWLSLWDIFSIMWWLCWIPTGGIFIAYISKGYKASTIMLATLALPALLLIATILYHHQVFTFPSMHASMLANACVLGVACCVLVTILFRHKLLSLLIDCNFPSLDKIKFRSRDQFIRLVIQLSVISLYLYLPTGIIGLCMLFFIFMLPNVFTLLGLCITVFKQIISPAD